MCVEGKENSLKIAKHTTTYCNVTEVALNWPSSGKPSLQREREVQNKKGSWDNIFNQNMTK